MKMILTIIKSPLIWRIMISLTVFLLLRELRSTHREIKRMSYNQELITQEQHKIRLSNGRIADQTGVLALKQKELNTLFPEIRKEIDLLKVHPGRVSSVSTISFEQYKSLVAAIRDSIAIVPKQDVVGMRADTLHFNVFDYHDTWYDVAGYAYDDQQYLSICSRDTMMQVVYRKRKTPWLWIFSPRVLEQRVYFKNPNANIYYSRTINIQR